ncbi:vacuolar protein sorting/targeting protein PEP1 [Entomophthora muscae]|uniref:Vacuolar protein sorting/targeting protein PEP1 n=1 Tax=Entomophthora muscae TaxID=34485 RepID=A0ACC2UDG6_9FUNG|nr:vacuolar protein sorting/targeting protein PEP1 [Entomophthora muscae]
MSYFPSLSWGKMGLVTGILQFNLLSSCDAAEETRIKSSITEFKFQPSKPFYFENSNVVLFLDTQDSPVIWRSKDEGKTWDNKTSPSGSLDKLYQHPFDDQKAIALTKGLTHYVTKNRGESWQSFQTPLPASFSNDPPRCIPRH